MGAEHAEHGLCRADLASLNEPSLNEPFGGQVVCVFEGLSWVLVRWRRSLVDVTGVA